MSYNNLFLLPNFGNVSKVLPKTFLKTFLKTLFKTLTIDGYIDKVKIRLSFRKVMVKK